MRGLLASTATHTQQEQKEKSLRTNKFARNTAGEFNWAGGEPTLFKPIRINRKTGLKNRKKENQRKTKGYWLVFYSK